ncbi:prolyl-tRNA synthetase associated domain-containing protein [Aurantimonas sp. Leaf443]|uniref:prolyl-tRNA synthetase associated domain-containing protein n=1 Tax=Aurantimonas sp. Leaf443 TaxID=1736378 RepID=UPI0006FB9FC4|nr:prolyl-tRNA synthetase associated domain-containing protein [Aurantimonas sp. Leaf443]KQT87437.1 DNA-binding protein [Aurantimonas sp. Leaf443]
MSDEQSPDGSNREARAALFAHLERLGIKTRTVEHEALFTVAQSQALHEAVAGGHTKNLFVKDKKGQLFLIVAEQATAVDLKNLHKVIGASGRLSFASPEQMRAHLAVSPGSVTAFGVMADRAGAVRLVLDERLTMHDMVNCHPMTNEATTTIARDDLLAFFRSTGHEPLVADLSERQDATA